MPQVQGRGANATPEAVRGQKTKQPMALATNGKMVSERHQIASESGKLTAGQAVKMIKKQGIQTNAKEVVEVFELINGRQPEWHHSGFYKSGGKSTMGRTYFFKAWQVQELAEKWGMIPEIKAQKAAREQAKKDRIGRQTAFLYANAIKRERIIKKPIYFIQTKQEMQGKHGWFDSTGKYYNLTEYYTGWELTEEQYRQYLDL